MARMARKLQRVAVGLVALVIYYSFLFGFVLDAKASIVNLLQVKGYTKITVPVKVYENGTWVDKTHEIDLVGFVDITLTLVIVFGPIIIIARWFL